MVKTILVDENFSEGGGKMEKVSKTEYVALRKKGEGYMKLPIHDLRFQKNVTYDWLTYSILKDKLLILLIIL